MNALVFVSASVHCMCIYACVRACVSWVYACVCVCVRECVHARANECACVCVSECALHVLEHVHLHVGEECMCVYACVRA